jgi:hypothetical protein
VRARDLEQRPDVQTVPGRVAVVVGVSDRSDHAAADAGLLNREHGRGDNLSLREVQVLGRFALRHEPDLQSERSVIALDIAVDGAHVSRRSSNIACISRRPRNAEHIGLSADA